MLYYNGSLEGPKVSWGSWVCGRLQLHSRHTACLLFDAGPSQLHSAVQALSVSYNSLFLGLPKAAQPSALHRLQALGTDITEFCASSLSLVPHMTALTRLCLVDWRAPDRLLWGSPALSTGLRQLPQLRVLGYYTNGSALHDYWVEEQVAALRQRLQHLECREMEGLLLPSEEAHTVPWDKVE